MVEDVAPKTRYVAQWAEETGKPFEQVRQLVRVLFDAGIGPRGHAPLTFSVMAAYTIGDLVPVQAKDAVGIVERYGAFFVTEADFQVELGPAGLPPLPATPLRPFLAAVIQALAEDRGVHLLELSADAPPHDAFRIWLETDQRRYKITFAPELEVVRRLRPIRAQRPLHRRTTTLTGAALEPVAYLGSHENFKTD